ncbi:MAG: hypothetical protein SGI71_12980 [Verrucomicrobiota bacterium]|nr:hypothetical protein [Verrucomicrobiota bacterium]
MRKEINWRTRREDGSSYEVRVHRWAGVFRFQFKEKGSALWNFDQPPTKEDWETLLDALERRLNRKQATYEEIEEVKKRLEDWTD